MSEEIETITIKYGQTRRRLSAIRDYGWVYIVRATNTKGPIKIGWSSAPSRRLKAMHWGSPVDLEFVDIRFAPRKFEGELHRKYAKKRIRGEWFNLSSDEIIELLVYIHERHPMGWVQSAER